MRFQPTKRPQNRCGRCGDTWYPRGSNVSSKCPKCGSTGPITAIGGRAGGPSVPGCLAILGSLSVIWAFNSVVCQGGRPPTNMTASDAVPDGRGAPEPTPHETPEPKPPEPKSLPALSEEVRKKYGKEDVLDLVKALDSPTECETAKAELIELGADAAEPLAQILASGSAAQQERAAQAIAWIGSACIEAVSAILNFYPDRGAKERAAHVLVGLGGPGVKQVVAALAGDQIAARVVAGKELVKVPEASVPPLIELLSTGNDAGRGEASGVLAKLGALSVDSLVPLLDGSRPETAYWAARTLGEIGPPAKEKALDRLTRLAVADGIVGKAARTAAEKIERP